MGSRTIGAKRRNVETLALSLDTATRRAEETTLNDEGETVPRHPGASEEVKRLTALHEAALAEMEESDAAEASSESHAREVTDGTGVGGSAAAG